MSLRADPYGRWVILAGVVLSIALFLACQVATRRAYDASLAQLGTVIDNTTPSVLHLIEVRRTIQNVYRDILLAGPDLLDEPTELRRRFDAATPVIDAHVKAYQELPALPAEVHLRASLEGAIAALRQSEERVLTAPDEPTARAVINRELVPASRDVLATTDAILTLNAQETSTAAREIASSHRDADDLSRVLMLGLIATLVAVGAFAFVVVARAERALCRRVDELDAFAGRVAHDLKGPLQPAVLALSVLRGEPLTPRGQDTLERLERSVARAAGLVDGLLAFARAAARPEPGARARVDVVALELEPSLQHLAAEERAALDLDVAPRLEVATSATVVGSIVENLARNALLHLGPSETRRVRVVARARDGAVDLEVIDTGPGIPADLARRLFRPFERGSERPGGSGLGLATVKRLVEAHGGVVSFTTQVGAGSTFRVRLPRPE
jgi:signal transduction histidine kinase